MSDYRGLRVLEAANLLRDEIREWLRDKRGELANQLRDAAGSFSARIAEGFGRKTRKDRDNFLVQAKASGEEILDHLRTFRSDKEIDDRRFYRFFNRTVVVMRMLNQFIY